MKSYLFSDVHSLGEFRGRIEQIIEKRVIRTLTKELVNYAIFQEAQGLLDTFLEEPMPYSSHSRGQNQYINNLRKLVKDEPDIKYLKHLLKSILEEINGAAKSD